MDFNRCRRHSDFLPANRRHDERLDPQLAMTETDRSNVLHDLDARHDELLAELEALDREVQQAIATIRPPAKPAAAAPSAGPSAPTC
ncbi:MAG TPA: hypothetical protein VF175_08835 [Lacipirellula sp.]